MSLVSLKDVLQPALQGKYAVCGVVCLGWEDARAYVMAAEAEKLPIILQAGPGCRAHTPLPVLGAMFRNLAESVSVPVVAHLDHGYSRAECEEAIDCGFTSVMFDGSREPLNKNIDLTAEIAELAHKSDVSCEGEIGFVGYSNGEQSLGTDPGEASRFAMETGVDAMAVSVGNVHLQENHEAQIDRARIDEIATVCDTPLVIHGGSGVPHKIRTELARNTAICKFNIGTELRLAFGQELRSVLANDTEKFDRVSILKEVEAPIRELTRTVLRAVAPAA